MRDSAATAARRCGFVLTSALLACLPAPATAQSTLEKAVRARQSAYYLMGQHMSRIGATVKGEQTFDKASLLVSADLVELVGRVVVDNYPEGSDRGPTRARSEIWKEALRFRQLAQASQVDAGKLKAAVHSGDPDAVKAAFGAAARSCKACHDIFRGD